MLGLRTRKKQKRSYYNYYEAILMELEDNRQDLLEIVLYEGRRYEPELMLQIKDSRTPDVSSQFYLDSDTAQRLLETLLDYLSDDGVGTGRY
jgi:hypothetical protein